MKLTRFCALVAVLALLQVWSTQAAVQLYTDKTDLTITRISGAEQVDTQLLSKFDFVYLHLYNPINGPSKKYKDSFLKVARKFSGYVGFGAVNCNDAANKELCSEHGAGPEAFPLVVFMSKKYAVLNGPVDDPSDLELDFTENVDALVQMEGAGLITTLTKKKVKKFDKAAQKQGKAQAILFTKQEKPSVQFQTMALEFGNDIEFAFIGKGNKKALKAYGLSSSDLPLLGVVPVLGEYDDADDSLGDRIRIYLGDLDNGEVQTAFLGLYSPTFQETKAHNLPIVELTDQSCLEHHCIDKGGICVFVYFDNDRPAETFKLLTTVQQVQRKAQSTGLFSFAYLDTMKAGSREFLSEAFGVTGDGYPKLLIYSAKKGQFHQMIGSFNAKRITTYLRSVQSGNVAAGPVPNKRPKLVQEGVENGVCEADIAQAKLEKKQQQQNPTADSDVSTRSKMRVQRGSGKAGLLIEAEDVEQINTVIDTPSHWMVMFTSEEVLEKEGEQAKLDEFKRCAKGLRGVVTFATFVEDDFTEGKFQPLRDNYASLISDAQQQGQESFVLYFVGGRDKDAMGEGVFLYEGSTNAKDMAKWAKTELVSLGKHIVETVETMDELMEVFRAAPFQPVGLFHSTQDTAPAMLQALATEFDEFMRFVFIPDTSDLSTGDEMNLMEAPSLLIMKGENAGDVPGQPGAYQVRQVFDPYRGPLRFNAIASTYMGLSDPFPRPLTDEETYTQTPFVTTTKAAPPTAEKHAEL